MAESIKVGRTLIMLAPEDEETVEELRQRVVYEVNLALANLEARIVVLEEA